MVILAFQEENQVRCRTAGAWGIGAEAVTSDTIELGLQQPRFKG